MNPARIGLAVASGVSVVCATCSKYWRARDAGIPGDRCLSETACGSPLAGKAFHDYEGPIRHFEPWCFVCGDASTHAVRHEKTGRLFGLCAEHVKFVTELRPIGESARAARVLVTNNKLGLATDLLKPKKPSLFDAIMEVESHYEDKRRA